MRFVGSYARKCSWFYLWACGPLCFKHHRTSPPVNHKNLSIPVVCGTPTCVVSILHVFTSQSPKPLSIFCKINFTRLTMPDHALNRLSDSPHLEDINKAPFGEHQQGIEIMTSADPHRSRPRRTPTPGAPTGFDMDDTSGWCARHGSWSMTIYMESDLCSHIMLEDLKSAQW